MNKLSINVFRAEYCAPDLLDINGKIPSIHQRLILSFKEALRTLEIPSKTINTFFKEVSHIHTKRHFRVALKFLILLALYLMTNEVYSGHGEDYMLIAFGTFSIFLIIVYLLSFNLITHKYYGHFSTLLTMMFLALYMRRYKAVKSRPEGDYTPASHIFLIMYAVLPIKLETTVSIGCLYTSAHLSILHFRVVDFYRLLFARKLWEKESIQMIPSRNDGHKSYVIAQFCLWIALHILGVYIHFCNQFRRRAAFLRLGENVKSQIKNKLAFESQMKCIEAIMPVSIKNEYWEERKTGEVDDFWVFTKSYHAVSILFADIVGFTKLSSRKPANEIVFLLNDIFNRFDDECDLNNCEKVGTMGDCYYCVAGCPVPRSDHAVCCIELGLGMCRIIDEFNPEYKENMSMRIGIHSGRVNAAIIGKLRFRFDVYSFDVFIANQTEATGKSGKVHITEDTFKLVKLNYTVEEGAGLFVKKEVNQGMAGKKLIDTFIKTYFVLNSSDIIPLDRCLMRSTSEWSSYVSPHEEGVESDEIVEDYYLDMNLNDNQKFIKTLTNDPSQTIKLFGRLPICNLTMKFIDDRIESEYISHTKTEEGPINIDSVQIAPFLDSIMALIYSFFILIAALICFVEDILKINVLLSVFLYAMGIAVTILNAWKCFNCSPKLKGSSLTLFNILSKDSLQNILQMYMACLSLFISLLYYDHKRFYNDYIYTMSYLSLVFFSVLNLILFTPPCTLLKMLTLWLIISVVTLRIVICVPLCPNIFITSFENYCKQSENVEYIFIKQIALQMALQFLLTGLLVMYLDRENQKNLRLCFYIRMEVQRRSDAAQKSAIEAKNMLHNIIPKHVLDFLSLHGGDITTGKCSYAKSINNVGTGFACISNFFSSYYREDYQSGRGALRLLNKIICQFDELILSEGFHDLDKIKTMNDCYMFTAGLNIKRATNKKHLVALMKFCLKMQEKLSKFNTEYIFGNEKFQLKVGVNSGTVTAGIIGITKPFFDVWGDTVNVASRMCSTAMGNEIQATENLYYALSSQFLFKQKGIWNIKGKGRMKIFICKGLHDKKTKKDHVGDFMNLM